MCNVECERFSTGGRCVVPNTWVPLAHVTHEGLRQLLEAALRYPPLEILDLRGAGKLLGSPECFLLLRRLIFTRNIKVLNLGDSRIHC